MSALESSESVSGESTSLPAKQRIEEVALRLFAERGQAGVSLREIARTAGVTPGLVVHHFGSKDGLRRQVDRKIIAAFSEMLSSVPADISSREVRYAQLDILLEENPAMVGYLRRLLLESEESGAEFFEQMMDFAFSDIRSHSDTETPYTQAEVARIFEGIMSVWAPLLLSPLTDRMQRYLHDSQRGSQKDIPNLPKLHITLIPPENPLHPPSP